MLVLPLMPSRVAAAELGRRFDAGYAIYKAVMLEALTRLDRMRQSRTWKAARRVPAGTRKVAKVRNAELERLMEAHHLGERPPAHYAAGCRTRSGWIGQHLDAACTQELAARAWRAVEGHLFHGRDRPRVPRRLDFTSIPGVARNTSSGKWQSITLRGRWETDPASGSLSWRHGLDGWAGPLTLCWGANAGASSKLVVPVGSHVNAPERSHNRLREEHALREPAR